MTDLIDAATTDGESIVPDVFAGEPGPEPEGPKVPKLVWACVIWLIFVFGGAIYYQIDRLLGGALPLQDPLHAGTVFGTAAKYEGPSLSHPLGTDQLGRDIFARNVAGGWISLVVAMCAVTLGVVVGGLLGSVAGYVRGIIETLLMATLDVILAFPPLILLLAVVAIAQTRNLPVIAGIIGLLSIPTYARVARANSLSISKREFVMAARAIGTKPTRILFREVIPNVVPTLMAYALINSAVVIVAEGTLAFLGLSVQPPTASWGNMINEARADVKQVLMPTVWPSLWLTLTVLSLNQLGDWLRSRSEVRESAL